MLEMNGSACGRTVGLERRGRSLSRIGQTSTRGRTARQDGTLAMGKACNEMTGRGEKNKDIGA